MNKMFLFTGVVFGIVVVLSTYEQIFRHHIEERVNLSTSKVQGNQDYFNRIIEFLHQAAVAKELLPKKTQVLNDTWVSRRNESSEYFVIVKDTVEQIKGWRPNEK